MPLYLSSPLCQIASGTKNTRCGDAKLFHFPLIYEILCSIYYGYMIRIFHVVGGDDLERQLMDMSRSKIPYRLKIDNEHIDGLAINHAN